MYREILQTVPHAVISIQVLASNYVCALNKMVKNRKSRWCKATEGFVTMNVEADFDVKMEEELLVHVSGMIGDILLL